MSLFFLSPPSSMGDCDWRINEIIQMRKIELVVLSKQILMPEASEEMGIKTQLIWFYLTLSLSHFFMRTSFPHNLQELARLQNLLGVYCFSSL